MQKEKTKTFAVIFWILTVLWAAVIFSFSAFTAPESTDQSNFIVTWLISRFGENEHYVQFVRKGAHFFEFFVLSFLINTSLYFTKQKKCPLPATAAASVYAVSDELHQLFVDGRSCQVGDWAIDTLGALCATATFLLLRNICHLIKQRRQGKNNECTDI